MMSDFTDDRDPCEDCDETWPDCGCEPWECLQERGEYLMEATREAHE